MDIKENLKELRGLPIWIQYLVAIATVFGTIFGGWGLYIILNQEKLVEDKITYADTATSTNLSELFSKALSYKTVLDRQNFLEKYMNSPVYGKGTVSEISKAGDRFFLDITVENVLFTCSQEKNIENERKIPLLKGKTVSFRGIFTYSNVYGHGLSIDDCELIK